MKLAGCGPVWLPECAGYQKWDTSFIIILSAGSPRILELLTSNKDRSVALFAIDCHTYNDLVSFYCRRETERFICVPIKVPEMGQSSKKWHTGVWSCQFETHKLLTYAAATSTSSLRHMALSSQTAVNSLDAPTIVPEMGAPDR